MKKLLSLLLMLLCVVAVSAQQFRITGTVHDKKTNDPIIGASILVKNTSNGIITDVDGKFELQNVSKGNTLIVSYVGYRSQNILVDGSKRNFSILLDEDNEVLDEVVVVGYGTQKKQDITGSVVSVGEGKFTEGVNTNAFQMINGKAAGET